MRRRHALVLLCVLGAAGIAVAATGRDRHEAIYPAQRIPIEFSHCLHVSPDSKKIVCGPGDYEGGVGAFCEACHENAPKSVKASDVLTPKAVFRKESGKPWPDHDACDSCHDIEHAAQGLKTDTPSTCETCHIGMDKKTKKVQPTNFPPANLVFNHQIHVDPKGMKLPCERCHFGATGNGMEEVDLSTRYQLPKMAVCLQCHNGVSAPADCKTCHVMEPSDRVQVSFETARLKPMQGDPFGLDHGPRYEFTHGTRAKLDRRTCSECHTDSYCATCHDSLQKPISVHPNDYITLHPLQAKMDSLQCDACHRFQSFCAACHERVGIGLDSDPTLRARNLRVHGNTAAEADEFVNSRMSPRHHSIAASRDIKQCIACHREESCMKCHATSQLIPGAQGISPHPTGFAAPGGGRCSGRAAALAAANDRGCLKCHTNQELIDKGCKR